MWKQQSTTQGSHFFCPGNKFPLSIIIDFNSWKFKIATINIHNHLIYHTVILSSWPTTLRRCGHTRPTTSSSNWNVNIFSKQCSATVPGSRPMTHSIPKALPPLPTPTHSPLSACRYHRDTKRSSCAPTGTSPARRGGAGVCIVNLTAKSVSTSW